MGFRTWTDGHVAFIYKIIIFSGTLIGTGNWQTIRVSQLELATIRSPVPTKLKTGTGPKT
jgi:hypothetical protein